MGWNDLIGRRIGPYEIVEELGRGGSARVYRAYQESLQRDVAIKVLLNDAEDRLGFVRRFERELEAVAQLHHPNIVEVYEAGELEDLVYLVMQCVNGGTFRQRLGLPLPVHEACSVVIQVAEALHHAHLRGIVHRDVKPSNMLIDSDNFGRVLLTDFGIAKLAGMRGLTKSGTTIGTPEYMAPEQAEGREIDARADVYSLGCVLYEALAGRAPFVGSAPVSVLYQQVHAQPENVRSHNPDVPRELSRVLERALAKQPEQRFASADSFAWALHPFSAVRERGTYGPLILGSTSQPLDPARSLDLRSGGRDASRPSGASGPQSLGSGQLTGSVSRGPSTTGLGAEGLDALFPDDPEAQAAREQSAAGPPSGIPSGYLSGPSLLTGAPPVRPLEIEPAGPRPTIPLAARPPSGPLEAGPLDAPPLDLPLTPEGQLDMHALMAQVLPPPPEPPMDFDAEGWAPPSDLPPYEQWARPEEVTPYTAWDPPPEGLDYETWEEAGEYPAFAPYESEAEQPPSIWGDKHQPAPIVTIDPATPPPIWRPEEDENLSRSLKHPARRMHPMRDRRALAGISVAAVLALALIAWLAASALGIARGAPRTTGGGQPTATTVPTATPSPAPTATPTQQQRLDQQAAAAMQGVAVTTAQVDACAAPASTTTFSHSDSIWVNVCLSGSASTGSMTVALEQGTAVVTTLASFTAQPGHTYHWAYYASNLAAGTYHVVITFAGGTAAVIPFIVQ